MQIVNVIFYLIMTVFFLYSLLAIYSLLRFGRSKVLGIVVALLYLIISASLYAAAVGNISNLQIY